MSHTHLFLTLAALGLVLMSVGFAWRSKPWGIALLAAGVVNMLSAVGYGIYLALYSL